MTFQRGGHVSQETRLVFVHSKVFKENPGTDSATCKMELFATIVEFQRALSDGLTTNEKYLHVAAVTRPSLQAKSKLDENGNVLNLASDVHSSHFLVF